MNNSLDIVHLSCGVFDTHDVSGVGCALASRRWVVIRVTDLLCVSFIYFFATVSDRTSNILWHGIAC
jgi:hypothetical protein